MLVDIIAQKRYLDLDTDRGCSGCTSQRRAEMKRFIAIFSIAVMGLSAFAVLSAQEILDDLVLAFSFEAGSGDTVRDMSGQGNDGQIEGSPSWVAGVLGKALYFDGGTYVVAPHIPFNERDFTIQLWAKPEMNTAEETVFTQHELNTDNQSLHLRLYDSGAVRMGFYSNDLDSAEAVINKGQWHNLTFMFELSSSTRSIYVDGKEILSDVSPSAYLGASGDTVIGVWNRPSKPAFYQVYQGAIDEVRVWHRLLDPDEMLSSMEMEMAVDLQEKLVTTWGKLKN